MADNVVDGVMRVGLDMSGVEKATPKAIQAFKALEREALKSTGAIAARGKQNLDQLGAAATAMQAKMAAVGGVRAAPGLSNRVAGLSNQLVSQAGAPGAANVSLSSKLAALRNNYLVTSGQMPPVQGPRLPPHLNPTLTPAQVQSQLNAQAQAQAAQQAKANHQLNSATSSLANARLKLTRQEQQDQQKLFAIQMRLASAPSGVQSQINSMLGGAGSSQARIAMMGAGASRNQAFFNQLTTGGVSPSAARYLIGGGGGRPPGWGGGAAGGGGAGGVGGFLNRNLGRFGMGIASGLGIGVGGLGGYAAIQGTRAVIESTQAATAYKRQTIAAAELAGSQEKLNALLDAYEKASGGAISKVTELNNVTRLLATGFADSAEEVERYVRATRGAAIALGKPEDYVIQETQLAISNTSVKRLDQIGLGIKEVNDEVERLRATNKEWNRETAFGEAVISLMEKKYGELTKTLEGQATGLELLRKAWADLYLEMGKAGKDPVDAFSRYVANRIEDIKELMEWEQKRWEQGQKIYGVQSIAPSNQDFIDPGKMMYGVQSIAPSIRMGGGGVNQYNDPVISPVRVEGVKSRSEEVQDVIDSYWQQLKDVETNYNKARLDEIRNYEEQRANLVRDFGRQMAREEEDFFRQRARSQRDYERSIVDLMRDAQERDAEMREDLEDKIADAREDSGKKIAEIEKEFNESREEAAKEHLDNLMKAAGQLDAIAVLEERKRWRRDQEQANKQHEKALKNEKDNLEEKIAEAREAYEEQLEDARKADAKRLEDMRVNRERQLADEDEDRAIRLARAAEDHDLQLEEMDRQHSLRMTQIATQAEEERAALEEAFGFALTELNVYVAGFQAKMEERDALIEAWFNRVVDRLEREVRAEQGTDYYYDPQTGPKIPTNYTTPLVSAAGAVNVSGGKSVVVQPGAIVINAHPAMDEERVADYALSKMADFLEEYNR